MSKTIRYPLASSYNSRINEDASTKKDGRLVNCFSHTVSGPNGTKRYVVKRPGWIAQTTLASGSKGTAIMSWTGQGTGQKVITAFGSTNSTIYDSANGLFVVSSNRDSGLISNRIQTSPDGITWTARTAAENANWAAVAYGNGLWVSVAYSFSTTYVMTSPDGISWTMRTGQSGVWYGITHGNGLFVAVGFGGANSIMTSPDGLTWTARTGPSGNWQNVTYGNGLYVAVASSGTSRIMTSADGITWTSRSSTASVYDVTYGNGLFVACGLSGNIYSSPDGITWTERTAAEANALYGISYGNGLFIIVSNNGTNRVQTSPDGITWTARSAAVVSAWNTSAYGNGLYVAVSASGKVQTSPDGITWTERTAAAANGWESIAYGTTSTSLGAITGYATGITETFVSTAPTLLISSSDNTAWNTSSDAVTGALTFTGDTHTNTTLDNISSITGLVVGQLLTGTGFAANTRIASIDSATAVTLTVATTATAAGVTVTRAILGKIVDADFPGNASLTLAGTFAHMDGYAFILTTDGKLWASDLNTVASWTATAFASANAAPDKGVACVRHRNFIVTFGAYSVEFFYNAGLTPFPLAKNVSMTQKVGLVSADALAAIADTLFWCGTTTEGGMSIFSYDAGIARISTPEIDGHLIAVGSEKINLTTLRYFGRSFVQVNAGPFTYAYCIEEKEWYEVVTTTPLTYKCTGVSIGGTLANYAISNSTSGKLYKMDHANLVFKDDGTAFTARMQLPSDDLGTRKRKFYSSAEVVGDKSPVTSTMTILFSDDDFQSETTAGTVDLSASRPILRRLGSGFRRSWAATHATDCAMRVEALEVGVEVGT